VSKLLFVWLVVLPLCLFAACSQPDTHPPLISDCANCTQGVIVSGGGETGVPDVSTSDGSFDDVTDDADGGDLVDTGTTE
jgi:hypothetical protein